MKRKLYLISSASIGSMGYAIAWKGCTLGRTDIWDKGILAVKWIEKGNAVEIVASLEKDKIKNNVNDKEKKKVHAYQYSH